jgi:two-component system sensor histidine kinase PilS (NtrC family)
LQKSPQFGAEHRIETRFAAESMMCDVDPNRLKQIFWNLAINALKAMPQSGSLKIDIDWNDDASEVEIAFADVGVGMDETEKQNYFQPFSGSFHEGTGLGAAIVYRLVQEHGGRIQVVSSPGAGTTVRIRLPREQLGTSRRAGTTVPRQAGLGVSR